MVAAEYATVPRSNTSHITECATVTTSNILTCNGNGTVDCSFICQIQPSLFTFG